MAWQSSQQLSQSQQQQQDLVSQFHLLPLIESAADALERGAGDQHVLELMNELAGRFDKCQQLLNSITISNSSKPMTVRTQKQKLEDHENQLKHRSDLILKYKTMVGQALNPSQ